MWPPGYSTSILQVFIICGAFTSKVLHFGNKKKYDSTRFGLYGGCSKTSQWNCSGSKACVCRAVYGRALLCNNNSTRERADLIGCRKRISRISQSAGFSISTAMATAISALTTYHVTRSDVGLQLHEAIFNITLNTRNK